MAPFIRILLRYGAGGFIGYQIGSQLASDPDVIAVTTVVATAIVGLVTEGLYILAKRYGWRT